MVCKRLKIIQAELFHHFRQSPASLVIAGGQGKEVPLNLDRFSYVGANDFQKILVDFSFLDNREDGDVQPFLKNLPCIRSKTPSADIHHMGR